MRLPHQKAADAGGYRRSHLPGTANHRGKKSEAPSVSVSKKGILSCVFKKSNGLKKNSQLPHLCLKSLTG